MLNICNYAYYILNLTALGASRPRGIILHCRKLPRGRDAPLHFWYVLFEDMFQLGEQALLGRFRRFDVGVILD